MALVPCRECGAEISDRALACPQCGAKIDRPNILLRVVVGLVVVFLAAGFALDYTPKGREMAKDRAELDDCWKRATSSTPAATKTQVSSCQMLHDWFVRKHGRAP